VRAPRTDRRSRTSRRRAAAQLPRVVSDGRRRPAAGPHASRLSTAARFRASMLVPPAVHHRLENPMLLGAAAAARHRCSRPRPGRRTLGNATKPTQHSRLDAVFRMDATVTAELRPTGTYRSRQAHLPRRSGIPAGSRATVCSALTAIPAIVAGATSRREFALMEIRAGNQVSQKGQRLDGLSEGRGLLAGQAPGSRRIPSTKVARGPRARGPGESWCSRCVPGIMTQLACASGGAGRQSAVSKGYAGAVAAVGFKPGPRSRRREVAAG